MRIKYPLTLVFCLCTLFCSASLSAPPEKLPQDAAREKLLTLLSGEWVSRALYVATKLDIADHLQAGPKSSSELAALTQCQTEPLERLLRTLASHAIFEEVSPGQFANTSASLLLAKSHPDSLHALSLFFGEDIHKSWDELLYSIRTSTPAFQQVFKQPVFAYFKENPTKAALFQEAMKQKSSAVVKSALSACDFGRFSTVYDIGGGYGQFMQALLQKHSHVKGMVFELPEVIGAIKKRTPTFDESRCTLCAGDFFTSVPQGGDAYLLKSVIHDWEDEKAEQLLKNCHQAMRPDSKLFIVEVVLLPKDQSIYAHCMDLQMLVITGGKERSLAHFQQMLERTGFTLEKIHPTSTEFSILEARKK